jgi:hypothetical protein
MTVLGIITTPDSLKVALVQGTRDVPAAISLKNATIKFVASDPNQSGTALLAAWESLHTIIQANRVDQVVVVKAVGSKFNGPSDSRLKLEGALELMCAHSGIIQHSVHPNAVANESKRFDIYTGQSSEQLLGAGRFKSKDSHSAHLAAWYGLCKAAG